MKKRKGGYKKLSEELCEEIKDAYRKRKMTQRELGIIYKVSHVRIAHIVKGIFEKDLKSKFYKRLCENAHKQIRYRHNYMNESQRSLAEEFGVSKTTIYRIIRAHACKGRHILIDKRRGEKKDFLPRLEFGKLS
jgi:transposase